MRLSALKLNSYATFFCVITGLAFGVILLCSNLEPDLLTAPTQSAVEELSLRKALRASSGDGTSQQAAATVLRSNVLVEDATTAAQSAHSGGGDAANARIGAQALPDRVQLDFAKETVSARERGGVLNTGEPHGGDASVKESSGGAADDEPEELPNPDVVEDGQDLSPQHKADKIREREETEAQERADAKADAEAEEDDDDDTSGRTGIFKQLGKKRKRAAPRRERKAQEAEKAEEPEKPEKRPEASGAGSDAAAATENGAAVEKQAEPEPVGEKKKKKKSFSIAALADEAARDQRDARAEEREKLRKSLTATEQQFIFQMTDMLAMSGMVDRGGERIPLKSMTEDEANAQDAEEYNSIKAYGASEEDLVTFLQVQQGMPSLSRKEMLPRLKAASDGVPLLTIDLVQKQAVDSLVFVTCASWGYYDFALNWAVHMRKLGITNFLIGALDYQTSLGLAALGIPGFQMFAGGEGAAGLSTQDFQSAQQTFRRISSQKVALARLFTDFGYDVVMSDVDSVWLRDPTAFFKGIPEVDLLVGSNELHSTLAPGDDGLELVHAIQGSLSMSVLYLRHSQAVTAFVKTWDELMFGNVEESDQLALEHLITKHTRPLSVLQSNTRVGTGPAQAIKAGVLPVSSFMNGHTFFVQRLHETHGVPPFYVHANFNEGGLRGKRHRMREAGIWKDPPAYFDSRYVQVLVTPPTEPFRSLSDEDMIRFHTDALQAQLTQVAAGMALAVALDRTLILPRLTCFCDRSWIGLKRCRAPGAEATKIPFDCPLDYVLDLERLDDSWNDFGPRLELREHNFLNRSSRAAMMMDSTVAVIPSGFSIDELLSTAGFSSSVPKLFVDPHLPDEGLRTALADQLSVQVLTFTDATRSFGGFKDAALATSVARRLERLSVCLGADARAGLPDGVGRRLNAEAPIPLIAPAPTPSIPGTGPGGTSNIQTASGRRRLLYEDTYA